MPVTYRYQVEDDYLHVVAEGSLCSVDEVLRHVKDVHGERVRAGLSKLLINEARCHIHMDFDTLESLSGALLGLNWSEPKVAVVTAEVNHPIFQYVYGSAVRIKFFTEEDEARRWLAED
jgi:hypothetical protein